MRGWRKWAWKVWKKVVSSSNLIPQHFYIIPCINYSYYKFYLIYNIGSTRICCSKFVQNGIFLIHGVVLFLKWRSCLEYMGYEIRVQQITFCDIWNIYRKSSNLGEVKNFTTVWTYRFGTAESHRHVLWALIKKKNTHYSCICCVSTYYT